MRRSGYTDDEDSNGQFAMWRGQVNSAIRGKRGQNLLRDMLTALDAMPEKQIFMGHLVTPEGGVCALGALGQMRGLNMPDFEKFIDEDGYVDDPESLSDALSVAFDAAHQLIREIQHMNDERFDWTYINNVRHAYTPEERWQKMRDWVASKIKE